MKRHWLLFVFYLSICKMQAQDTTVSLKETVFTGALKEIRKEEFATPVEIYGKDYFKSNSVTNLYEALQMISGIQANVDGALDGSGDVEINGMEGIYTLIMIDGNPISGGNAGVYALSGIPIQIIERVEVIKGPASTLYGTDAIAGVVNVITANPEKANKLFVNTQLTSYLESNTQVAARLQQENAHGLLAATYFNQNKKWDFDKDNLTDVPLQNRVTIFNKWSFRNRFQKLSSVYARYLWENRKGGEMQMDGGSLNMDSLYQEKIYTHRIEVAGNFQLPVEKFNLQLQTAYSYHAQNSIYGLQSFRNEEHNGRISFVYSYKNVSVGDLLVGAQYRFSVYDDNLKTTEKVSSGKIVTHPIINHFPAFFIQDMITLNTHHEILAGLRYEYNTFFKGSTLSPRFDYKWMNSKRSDFFRLSVGSGFRTPNFFADDRFAFVNGKKIIIAGDTKSELAYGLNLSYEKKINSSKGQFQLECKPFTNFVINKIEAINDSLPDAVIYHNEGTYLLNYGVNLNTQFQFRFPLKTVFNFTFLKSYSIEKEDEITYWNDQVKNAPLFNFTYNLQYTIAKSGWRFDLNGFLNSPMFLNTQPNDFRPAKSPWYSIMNIQISKKFKKGVELYVGINNLLNHRPKNTIMRPFDPFNKTADNTTANPNGYRFDTTYTYLPNQGIKGFVGLNWIIK